MQIPEWIKPAVWGTRDVQSTWERGEIMTAQGWATMPRTEEFKVKSAEVCSERLLEAGEAA